MISFRSDLIHFYTLQLTCLVFLKLTQHFEGKGDISIEVFLKKICDLKSTKSEILVS